MLRDFIIKLENALPHYAKFNTNEDILDVCTSRLFIDILVFDRRSKKLDCLSNNKNMNPMDTFFACAENENQVVEIKNVDLKIKKYNSFSNAKKYNLSYDKNIFSNGSAAEKVGPFFDYIKRFITTIKSYFDYFIERKYKCRIFAT